MKVSRVAIVFILLLVLSSCGGYDFSNPNGPLRIGVAAPLSGSQASHGLPSTRAAELVVDQVNQQGGIDGRMMELVVVDDQCDPDIASNRARELIEAGVGLVLGHICSGATQAALPLYQEAEIVVISPSATYPPLSLSGQFPGFFRTIANDRVQAAAQIHFLTQVLGVTRLALFHDGSDYGLGLSSYHEEYLSRSTDLTIVAYEQVSEGPPEDLIDDIIGEAAQAVLWSGYHESGAELYGQLIQKDQSFVFMGGDGIVDGSFIDQLGERANGVYGTAPQLSGKTEQASLAVDRYREAYSEEPGPFFLNAYGAMEGVVHALDSLDGGLSYENLRRALSTLAIDSVIGPLDFDRYGDPRGLGFDVYQVVDREYVRVYSQNHR